jgi:hypothetical protein
MHPRNLLITPNWLTMLAVTGLLWTGPLLAVNCSVNDINLFTQEQVDNFQTTYGPCDRVVNDLSIDGADINDLRPLSGLTTVSGGLYIFQTTNLFYLSGLEGLTSVGLLSINRAHVLTSLAGLQNITSMGSMGIVDNAVLPNLNGLPAALESLNSLGVMINPLMTSLEGMPAIGQITGIVRISDNAVLTNIAGLASSGFPNDSSPQVEISIHRNPSLASLAGLPTTNKAWSLGISENAILTSLGGLDNLVEVWEHIDIIDNPSLEDCSALVTVLDEVDDGDAGPSVFPPDPPDSPGLENIYLSGNLGGCNSIAEILLDPEDDIILADGFEGG